jgi:hypothetical protein
MISAFFKTMLLAGSICLVGGDFPALSYASAPPSSNSRFASRYSLPESVTSKPFSFAGQIIPLERRDVRERIVNQVNFLLMDARSVLSEWLTERTRYWWVLKESLAKEGLPEDFVLFSYVLSGLGKSEFRGPGAGVWALEKPCSRAEGVDMSDDTWHDDRMDMELATRCFATRIKSIRTQLGSDWLMAAAAYVTSPKTIENLTRTWDTRIYWDLPLPDPAEDMIVRWIALGIIHSNREAFRLGWRAVQPATFDQVSQLILSKDLPVGEIARMSGVSAREILDLNPKIKPSSGILPARIDGKSLTHTIAAPKGKGRDVVDKLKKEGYLEFSNKPQ